MQLVRGSVYGARVSFVLRRRAARVVCRDPDDRIVMIRSSDPADPRKEPWWELPGGGIDHGETPEQACERELREEIGITDAVIGPCIWTNHAQFEFAGWHFDQHEQIFLATASGEIGAHTRREVFEALAFGEVRWWVPAELLADTAPTVPPRLREFLPAVLTGPLPDQPVDISPEQ
jgi:8-oxo-dGTP pyrophosphatase MutT (NUDIX family)